MADRSEDVSVAAVVNLFSAMCEVLHGLDPGGQSVQQLADAFNARNAATIPAGEALDRLSTACALDAGVAREVGRRLPAKVTH